MLIKLCSFTHIIEFGHDLIKFINFIVQLYLYYHKILV